MIICESNQCVGCMACKSVCPMNAIQAKTDERGFAVPLVTDECINCGKCRRVCPINRIQKNPKTELLYAAYSKDGETRRLSSSGGIFSELSKAWIKNGGVVYGAAFNDNFELVHKRISQLSELQLLRGSKYLQSSTEGVYKQVESDLKNKISVMFSGTPCQLSGLKNYLVEDYDNLLCVDLICHGVPSPGVFKDYLSYIRKENGRDKVPAGISFRWKKPSWSVYSMRIQWKDRTLYLKSKFKDPYLALFLANGGDLTVRKSCFNCKYTSQTRMGDITLGDFWMIKAHKFSERGIEKGVGLVIVNTEKGRKLFDSISDSIVRNKETWEQALQSNKSLQQPWNEPESYEQFWNDYSCMTFEEIVQKYCDYDCRTEIQNRWWAWKRAHWFMFPNKLIRLIKMIKNG